MNDDAVLSLRPEQQRSVWLAWAIAGRIVADAETARALGRKNVEKMRAHARGSSHAWLDEWTSLLDGPVEALLAAYTSPTERGSELRQHNPFAGLLTDAELAQVRAEWRRLHPATPPDGDCR